MSKCKTYYTILAVLVFTMLYISAVSAFDFDNSKSFVKDSGRFGKIEVRNLFGLGSKVADLELKNNTFNCLRDCSMQTTITLYDSGVLVDDVYFDELVIPGWSVSDEKPSYTLSLVTGYESVLFNHEQVCELTGKVLKNGSSENLCQTKNNYYDKPIKRSYSLGEVLPAGNYSLLMEGTKNPLRVYDWKIKSQGIITNEWANWGNMTNLPGWNGVTVFDYTGRNNGSISGNVTISSAYAKVGTGGANLTTPSWINITGSKFINLSESFTFSLWFNPKNYSGALLYKGWNVASGYGLEISSGRVVWNFKNTTSGLLQINSGAVNSLTLNDWYLATGTYNGTNASLYLNGVLRSSGNINNIGNNTDSIIIGRVNFATFYLNASLDEVMIFNRSLSSSEVSDLYSNNSAGFRAFENDASLVAYYDFDDGYAQGMVSLLSPNNNVVSTSSQNNFSCFANITLSGSYLTNVSLWENASGVWKINQTINASSTGVGDYQNDQTDPSMSTSQAGITQAGGFFVSPNGQRLLVNGTLDGAVDCTRAYVMVGNNIINYSDNKVGSVFLFNNFPLNATSTSYAINCNKSDGGTYTRFYNPGSPSYPFNRNGINITSGYWNGGSSSGDSLNFINIMTAKVVTTNSNTSTTNFSLNIGSNIKWSCSACASDNTCGMALENRTLYYNPDVPQINFTNPTETNNSFLSRTFILINVTASDNTLTNISLFLLNGSNSVINQTSSTTSPLFANFSGLTDGTYYFNASATDSFGTTNKTETRTITIDTTQPNITFTYPGNIVPYQVRSAGLQINWTITETNPQACILYYNGVNNTVTCSDNTSTINTTAYNPRYAILYANDSLGNEYSKNISWDYYIFQNGLNYETTVSELETQTISLNTTLGSKTSSATANLIYDNSVIATVQQTEGINTLFNASFNTPEGSSGKFYFNISVLNTSSSLSFYNTTNQTQIITNFSLINCTAPNINGLTLNFTTYLSGTSEPLNASFESTFVYYPVGGEVTSNKTLNFASINESRSNWMFCLDSTDTNATISAFTSYYADGYDRREYIIDNGIIGNFTQNIALFLAPTADTDVVTVIVKDQNYNPITGALVAIQEWDIGTNTFSTVGMFYTTNEGTGIINLELFNTWYRAVISINGTVVETTEPQKLSTTTWNIPVTLEVSNPYTLFGTISHSLTFNNATNITTYTWLDSSGYTQQGCLQVRNLTTLGYDTLSLECTVSVSATINYLLPADGEYEITGTIYLLPVYNVSELTDTLFVRLGTPSLTETVSSFGKVLSFIFIGTAAAVGISAGSPIWGAILLIGSIFISAKLGWMNVTQGILWGLLSIIVVVLFRLSKKQ